MKKSHKCTLMLLFNLAKPDWISMPCDKKLLSHVVCYVPKYGHQTSVENVQNVKDYNFCSPDHLAMKQNCYAFLWLNKMDSANKIIKRI